jgi:hypothetical protein|tara:strand:- start:396 stop:842 length:447 start_codon:yes stop_codon:yes gene_type:complete
MAVIKPTLSLTSNASTATTDAGPLSIALSLSATDTLTVDTVTAATVTPTTTHSILFDGSAQDAGSEVAGTNGAFIYMKNTSAADYDIYIGIEADGASATALEGNADAQRLFTLKQGEFAFFPYDYTMDISVDAENNDATLEYFMFNRG